MQLNKKEKEYKEYINLTKEYKELQDKIRAYPLVKLDKPYQNGWETVIDFRDDFKNRDDYEMHLPLLKLHDSIIIKSAKIVSKLRKAKNLYEAEKIISKYNLHNGKEYKIKREHFYSTPGLWVRSHKLRKKFTEEEWEIVNQYITFSKDHYLQVLFPYHYLILKVKPRMIMEVKDIPGELIAKRDELSDKLYEMWRKYSPYGYKRYPANSERMKMRAQIQKFLVGENEDIYNEKIRMIWD